MATAQQAGLGQLPTNRKPDDSNLPARPQAMRGRIPELDGLRGIAVLMVLGYHLFGYSMLRESWTGIARMSMLVTMPGWLGVDLFFVLSGFLITGILLDTRGDDRYLRNFYARRALRIFPLYYTVLLIIVLCYRNSGSYALLSFFYLSNLAPLFATPMVNGVMWSLSVEEHFYMVWPFLVGRLRRRAFVWVPITICIAEPVIRGLAYGHVSDVYVYTWFRLDGLAYGALAACFVRSSWYTARNATRVAAIGAIAGLLLMAAGAPFGILHRENAFGYALQYTPMHLIFTATVIYAATRSGAGWLAVLRSRPLEICADFSYCIYLTHALLMDAYDASVQTFHIALPASAFGRISLRAFIVTVACFGVAAISRRFLELPVLQLKRYFQPGALDRKYAHAAKS
jgi:peptidoglycan/LPS O-acetylase OafA/YrhL